MPLRTGYERVIGRRTGPLFCKTATREGGVVQSIKENVITIVYPNGDKEAYQLGRIFGKWSGEVVPHNVVTGLRVGDSVAVGQPIVYNSNYFQLDSMNPKEVIYKNATLARTVFWESANTLEDSCAISEGFVNRMVTRSTEIRNIRVEFHKEIANLVNVGDLVNSNSILCTIFEPIGDAEELYEGAALDTLTQISSLNPTAKVRGEIERIEVIYSGDIEHMSPSLNEITNISDRAVYKTNRQLGAPNSTGYVEPGYRVDNVAIGDNVAIVRVYITRDVDMGIADKLVVCHQMKATIGAVIPASLRSEDNRPIDIISGYDALMRRMVLSAEFTGTTNTCLLRANELALAAYDSDTE